jgi:esterase
MKYREMAEDLLRFADSKGIDKFSLLGHNIGAKTAMTLSCLHPERVRGLISIDTSPKSFVGDKQQVKQTYDGIQKIKGLDIEGKTRKTAMDFIQKSFSDPGIANFVASNLVYDGASDRKFVKWCVNLDSILENIEQLVGFESDLRPYKGPALFLNGGLSVKVEENIYKKYFPNAKLITVEGAGHYVHTDKPKITIESITLFLEGIE